MTRLTQRLAPLSAFSFFAFFASTLLITGCGVTSADLAAGGVSTTKATISGNVHGGRQPVAGAHVFVMEITGLGNGGNGIAASTANASKSLLNNYTSGSFPTTLDSDSSSPTYNDYYVTTDSNGSFSIGGEYSCDKNYQVYIYVQGGDPGNGTNPVATFLGYLGLCPHAQNFATALPTIYINELSTVATAYALAGLATDPLHIGDRSSSTVNSTYVDATYGASAMSRQAGLLYNISTGASVSTQTIGTTTITSPQTRVDALANSLAACINSTGAASTACSTLFSAATADGKDTGTPATDTADAAINIAHWPAHRVSDIFGIASTTPPWQPTISDSSTLTDWAMPVTYTDPAIVSPSKVFIDDAQHVWLLNKSNASIVELVRYPNSTNPAATTIYTDNDYVSGSLAAMYFGDDVFGVISSGYLDSCYDDFCTQNSSTSYTLAQEAVAPAAPAAATVLNSNVYYSDQSGNIYALIRNSCQYGASYTCTFSSGTPAAYPAHVMVNDGLGHILLSGLAVQKITLDSSGNISSFSEPYTGNNQIPTSMAVDSHNNIWLGFGAFSHFVWEMDNNGNPLSGSNGYSLGGVGAFSIAIDGNGLVWISPSSGDKLIVLSPTDGTILSGGGYNGGIGLGSLAIDSTGSVWGISGTNTVTQLMGIAGPVTTDLVYAASENKLGSRP